MLVTITVTRIAIVGSKNDLTKVRTIITTISRQRPRQKQIQKYNKDMDYYLRSGQK